MKNIFRKDLNRVSALLLVCLFIFVTMLPAMAFAEEGDLWNSKIYHAGDSSGVIDETRMQEIMDSGYDMVAQKQFDFASVIVPEDNLAGYDITEFAEYLYGKNEFGYGPEHDGTYFVVNTTNETFYLYTSGRGRDVFNEERAAALADRIREAYLSGGYQAMLEAYYETAPQILDESGIAYAGDTSINRSSYMLPVQSLTSADAVTSDGTDTGSDAGSTESESMPDWYVTDPDSFVSFHNPDAPKVVDNADILTDEEEAQLSAMIAEIVEADQRDLVVFTDNSSHGLDHKSYASDFYTYNGYGIGDNYDGAILFVCMDPDNRGFYTAACGSVRDLWTETNANQADDIVQRYLKAGNYSGGFTSWARCMDSLFNYGTPVASEWYINYMKGEPAPEAPSLVQNYGFLTDEEEQSAEAELQRISQQYGVDCVALFDYTAAAIGNIEYESSEDRIKAYAETFHDYYGYSENCVMLVCLDSESSADKITVIPFGTASETFTKKICGKLSGKMQFNLSSKGYGKNMPKYLDALEYVFEKGRAPAGKLKMLLWAVLSAIAGAIAAGIRRARAVNSMHTVTIASGAKEHVVPGSLSITKISDTFSHTRTDKKYDPIKKDDDNDRSSSGSSRSTYDRSFTSSSGREFTGSGRSF